jgi:predicted oxidoreductase
VSSLFRRHEQPPAPSPPQEDQDAPDALRRRLWELVQFINKNAGRLPVEAVVVARQVTDTIREVIDTSDDRPLDVYAVVQINGIVGDYLPTTLRTYLNLDPSVTEQVGPAGRTPRAALREQVEALRTATEEMLQATRSHDADLLFSQGNFLRTKFTRSDLDL